MSQTATTLEVQVENLSEWLEEKKPVLVVDVRAEEDFEEWAIPDSVNVPVYQAIKAGDPNALSDVPLPDDRPIVTVCFHGNSSAIAARQLRSRGLEAYSLAGGMQAWSLAWNTAEISLPDRGATIIQVRRTGKGCLSYLIGSGQEAVVIDPSVDTDVYLKLARTKGWRITTVLETHVHADHLTRGHLLSEATGARYLLPDQQRVSFPFDPVRDGDTLTFGDSKLIALHTPGHTWESTCYWLDEQALFSGDTLFLNAVGRPDLKATGDETTRRARALFQSLQRLLSLTGDTVILPCHTDHPVRFDRKPIADTLNEITPRIALLHCSEDAFVRQLIERIPPTPPNHLPIVTLNETGAFPCSDPTELEAGANRCAIS